MGFRIWKGRGPRLLAAAEGGQTLVEYALILVSISLGTIGAMMLLRGQLAQVFSDVVDLLQ